MTLFDLIAGIAIGIYLLSVAVHGNSDALIETAKQDKAFIKWAVAVALLAYLYKVKELRPTIGLLVIAAFIAFGLRNIENIKSEASTFWASL